MEIRLNDGFIIGADRLQFILYREEIVTKGKNAGKLKKKVFGYFPFLAQALLRAFAAKITGSDAKTLHELGKDMEKYSANIVKAIRSIDHDAVSKLYNTRGVTLEG
jgi:hypothetical protein